MLLNLDDQGLVVASLLGPFQAACQRHVGQQRIAGTEIERQRHGWMIRAESSARDGAPSGPRHAGGSRGGDQAAGDFVPRSFGVRRPDGAAFDVTIEFGQLITEDRAVEGIAVRSFG